MPRFLDFKYRVALPHWHERCALSGQFRRGCRTIFYFLAVALANASPQSYSDVPNPAIHLTATLTSPIDVTLEWKDPLPSSGHIPEMALKPDGPFYILTYCLPGETKYIHSHLVPGTTFYYRVRAIYGPMTKEVTVTLPKNLSDAEYADRFKKAEDYSWDAPKVIPDAAPVAKVSIRDAATAADGAPTDLKATLVPTTVSGILFTWTSHSNDEEGFFLEEKTDADADFKVIATMAPKTNSFGIGFRPPQRSGIFRIQAFYFGESSNLECRVTGNSSDWKVPAQTPATPAQPAHYAHRTMNTDSGHPIQRKFSWWLAGGIAVAASAVVVWSFLSGNNPARPSPSPQNPAAPASPVLQTAEDRQLLGSLREKLANSTEDTRADLEELARSQPERAIELANSLGRTDAEKAAWVRAIVKQWADRNPGRAWDWVVRPNNSLANNSLLTVVMDSMATFNPEMLVGKMTAAIVTDDNSGGLLAAKNVTALGLQALVRNGNVDAAKTAVETWANDPSKPQIGEAAYDIVAMGMDQKDPANIGAWLRSLPASPDREAAIDSLVYNWGTKDPVTAIHWAQDLAPQEGQAYAISRVFGEWIQADPTKAMNWLDDYLAQTPNGVAGDEIIGHLVLYSPLTKDNPSEAAKLADSIANPSSRFVYQQQVYQSWARSDAPAAIQSVQNSTTIDADQKKQLLQEIQESSSPNPPEQ